MVRFEASTVIRRPIEEVFEFVSDPDNDPVWDTDVQSTRRVTGGPIGVGSTIEYRFRFLGKTTTAQGEVVELEAPRREVIQFGPGVLGARPRITYRLERQDGSTRFTRAAEASAPGIGRVLEPMFRALLSRRNAAYVEELRRHLEGPVPQH